MVPSSSAMNSCEGLNVMLDLRAVRLQGGCQRAGRLEAGRGVGAAGRRADRVVDTGIITKL